MLAVKPLVIIFSAAVFFQSLAFGASKSAQTLIRIENTQAAHPSVSEFVLQKEADRLSCKSKSVPDHRIQVKGQTGLEAPFKTEKKISPNCPVVLHWGSSRMCYEKWKNTVVDDVLRQCSQF